MEKQMNVAASARVLFKKYNRGIQEENLVFTVDESLNGDEFSITRNNEKWCVCANSPVGFNSAVGRLLRAPLKENGEEKVGFDTDFRSVYFANHFYNFYHSAPIEEIEEYIESLALWGQNVLWLWLDLHHFTDMQDENTQKMVARMNAIFKKAKSLGIKVGLGWIANEFYSVSPASAKAEYSLENGLYKYKPVGFYHTELCPSSKEGERLIMKALEERLQVFQEVGLDFVWLWPYDQGGCTCEKCYPWGGNGFFKLAKKQADLLKRVLPSVKIILSTWRFGVFCDGEWEPFMRAVEKDGDFIDYLMVDIDFFVPEKLYTLGIPVVSFPEISMYGTVPWGGFGANPMPKHLQETITKHNAVCKGGACYSEGIFEDINKIVALDLFRDPTRNAREIVAEYCAYHFGKEYAEELAELIMRMESSLQRSITDGRGNSRDYPVGRQTELPFVQFNNSKDIEYIYQKWKELDERLPETVRKNWRYEILRIRAYGDAELLKNGGKPNAETDKLYQKLVEIYFAQNALYCVAPFTQESIFENRSDGVL